MDLHTNDPRDDPREELLRRTRQRSQQKRQRKEFVSKTLSQALDYANRTTKKPWFGYVAVGLIVGVIACWSWVAYNRSMRNLETALAAPNEQLLDVNAADRLPSFFGDELREEMMFSFLNTDPVLSRNGKANLRRLILGEVVYPAESTDSCEIHWKINEHWFYVMLYGETVQADWFDKLKQQVEKRVHPFFPKEAEEAIQQITNAKLAWQADNGARIYEDHKVDPQEFPNLQRRWYKSEDNGETYRQYNIDGWKNGGWPIAGRHSVTLKLVCRPHDSDLHGGCLGIDFHPVE